MYQDSAYYPGLTLWGWNLVPITLQLPSSPRSGSLVEVESGYLPQITPWERNKTPSLKQCTSTSCFRFSVSSRALILCRLLCFYLCIEIHILCRRKLEDIALFFLFSQWLERETQAFSQATSKAHFCIENRSEILSERPQRVWQLSLSCHTDV